MRSILIVNPSAGQLHSDFLGTKIDLTRLKRHVDEATPTSADDTSRIVSDVARTNSHEIIYVAGGDGTVNIVASAILEATPDATAETRPAIGIIPNGTCNVLAGELGITDTTVTAIIGPRGRRTTRRLDVGVVGDRYFLLMAGYGIDGETVHNVNKEAKGIFGASAYAVSALAALAIHKPSIATITIDSETFTAETSLVLIANAQSYGLNLIKLAPEASLDDGWLDICVFEPSALAPTNLISHVARSVTTKNAANPDVRYFRGKTVKIDARPQMPGQLDGDPSGHTPVTINLKAGALRFLVPRPPAKTS